MLPGKPTTETQVLKAIITKENAYINTLIHKICLNQFFKICLYTHKYYQTFL